MNGWELRAPEQRLEAVRVGTVFVRPGDRIRLRPRFCADIMDLALAGKIATVASIEQDFEDHVYVAVIVDDDPGKDFGEQRQIGHRFLFSPDELEPVDRSEGNA